MSTPSTPPLAALPVDSGTLRYAATGLAACGGTVPELTLLEAITLADVVVPVLQYQRVAMPQAAFEFVMADSVTLPPEFAHRDVVTVLQATRAHMARRGNVVSFQHPKDPLWEHHLVVTAVPLSYDDQLDTAALNGATLTDRLPLSCRAHPVPAYVPDELVTDHARFVCAQPAPGIDTGAIAPVLVAHDTLVSLAHRTARAETLAQLDRERGLVHAILSAEGDAPEPLPDIAVLMRETQQGRPYNVSFAPVVLLAHGLGLVPDEQVLRFFDQQVACITRMTTAAVGRHRRAERETTDLLRGLATFYGELLETLRGAFGTV
jgi:hypothetical protein